MSLLSRTGVACSVVLSFTLAWGCSKSDSGQTSATTQPGAGSGAPSASSLKIAVIPKGTTHAYWKTVRLGAQAAADEAGVEMTWQGPPKEDDRAGQIGMVQQFVTSGINGIVLAPLDSDALVAPVGEATAKNIPVVIIDSSLKGTPGKDFASFVATNNHQAGVIGGEELARELGNKGKVVLLRYNPGSASTDQRESGFLEAMAKHPDITVISKDQYGGANQGESKTTALNMLDKLQEANGIFCPNESSTLGMLGALEQAQLTDKVKFVGFDATPALIDGLRQKKIGALVAQDPRKMGYLGVKTLISVLKKQPVDANIDTGTALVTLDNVDTPEIQKILGK